MVFPQQNPTTSQLPYLSTTDRPIIMARPPLVRLIVASLALLFIISIQSTAAFHSPSVLSSPALLSRGGSEEYDDSESEYDSDEEVEEPIILKTKALASSTKSKIVQSKKIAAKSAAAKAMSTSKPVAVRGGVGKLYRRMVPYIIRACLNPFTFVRMSRAYFASLIDINYLKEVSVFFLLILSVSKRGVWY